MALRSQYQIWVQLSTKCPFSVRTYTSITCLLYHTAMIIIWVKNDARSISTMKLTTYRKTSRLRLRQSILTSTETNDLLQSILPYWLMLAKTTSLISVFNRWMRLIADEIEPRINCAWSSTDWLAIKIQPFQWLK